MGRWLHLRPGTTSDILKKETGLSRWKETASWKLMLNCQPRTSDITCIISCTWMCFGGPSFWGAGLPSNDHKNRFYCMCDNSRENSYPNSFFHTHLYVNVAGSWLFFTAVPFNCYKNERATGDQPATDQPSIHPSWFYVSSCNSN